jgi:hypothetical protein
MAHSLAANRETVKPRQIATRRQLMFRIALLLLAVSNQARAALILASTADSLLLPTSPGPAVEALLDDCFVASARKGAERALRFRSPLPSDD